MKSTWRILSALFLSSVLLLFSACANAPSVYDRFVSAQSSFCLSGEKGVEESLQALGSSETQMTEWQSETGVYNLNSSVQVDGLTFDRYVDITLTQPQLTGIWYVAALPATEENLQKLVTLTQPWSRTRNWNTTNA